MTQQYADSFIVTSGFNTTGGEAVPQTVIFQFGDVELRHQTIVIVTIRAWFCWTLIISKHIKSSLTTFFNGLIIDNNSLLIGISRQEFFVLGVLMTNSVCFSHPQ